MTEHTSTPGDTIEVDQLTGCCPECGFDLHADVAGAVATIAAAPESFIQALRDSRDLPRRSAADGRPDGWSTVEHAAHLVRVLDWTRREILELVSGRPTTFTPFQLGDPAGLEPGSMLELSVRELESAAAWLVGTVPLLARNRRIDGGGLLRTAAHEVSHHCQLVLLAA